MLYSLCNIEEIMSSKLSGTFLFRCAKRLVDFGIPY